MIKLANVTKRYAANSLVAVNSVSMDVRKGEFIAIMGKSGCGKSTLLNVMGCIDTYDHGNYLFLDTEIASLSAKHLAHFRLKNIGYIYQSFNLINELNCMDNISLPLGYAGLGAKQRKKRAQELLSIINLSDKETQYPSQLSGGQQQRIAIARALANNPCLLLADEPTGNLDYANGIEIMNILTELNRSGVTIIMVTHDSEFSSYAGRIINMQDGKFI